jgi:SAM-dependent methyltransferase
MSDHNWKWLNRMHDDPTSDSKALWKSIHDKLPTREIKLGRALAAVYVSDPRMLAFISARYKFVAKMIGGTDSVLEIGCGDGFGAPIVAQTVKNLLCTDINEESLADNKERLAFVANLDFRYADFRADCLPHQFGAAYAVDVLEHVFPNEEEAFLGNIARSLIPHGVALFGTPNVTSEQYASEYSRLGHVNLQSSAGMQKSLRRFFHNVFMFGMNDEVVHTGYAPMAHYLWALCVDPI